jgi:hypothetical protein
LPSTFGVVWWKAAQPLFVQSAATVAGAGPAQLILEPRAPHAEDKVHRNHHPFMELPSISAAAATMSTGAITSTAAIVMPTDLRNVIRLMAQVPNGYF